MEETAISTHLPFLPFSIDNPTLIFCQDLRHMQRSWKLHFSVLLTTRYAMFLSTMNEMPGERMCLTSSSFLKDTVCPLFSLLPSHELEGGCANKLA